MKSKEGKDKNEKSTVEGAPSLLRVKYDSHPYDWKNLLWSPEVLLSLICVFGSTYLLLHHPSNSLYSQLLEYCRKKSEYNLQNRDQELAVGEPSSIPTDCVFSVMSWLSVCFFLSACCRVVLKAERRHTSKLFEESLQCNFNDALRQKYLLANEKALQEENTARGQKDQKPLKPYIKSSRIVGDDVLIKVMTGMCLIFAFILIYFVLYGDLNQVRAFGIIVAYSMLIAGITAPKIFDDVLTLQHWVGVMQNICCAGLLALCFVAVTNQ